MPGIKVTTAIYKYMVGHWDTVLELPRLAKILHFGLQGNQMFIWAMVDPKQPIEKRKIMVLGTGCHEYESHGNLIHIGTIVTPGNYVWHCFEEIPW